MKKHLWGVATVAFVLYWIGVGLTMVHEQLPLRTGPSEFGWMAPITVAAIVIPPALFAFLWGRDLNKGKK